jgi:hypothetical protein
MVSIQARYVILRVLLEAGRGLVELKQIEGEDGTPDLEVVLSRDLIPTVRSTQRVVYSPPQLTTAMAPTVSNRVPTESTAIIVQ